MNQINLDALPRAVALQYDKGELVYAAGRPPMLLQYDYANRGMRVFGKSVDFSTDPAFQRAYQRGWSRLGKSAAQTDDASWIVHIAIWAAAQAAWLDGDFVECGVNTGLLSVAICDFLDFNRLDKDFWLFDTFAGIPEEQMSAEERAGIGGWHNRNSYEECYAAARDNFAEWPRCRLVRGRVPETLAQFPAGRRVAYLSIDMNIVLPEIAAIEFFWDRLVPGALVLLDDYAWATHRAQKAAFDAFAAARDRLILTLPTGQGLLIR
jgi:hypothetical protein